MIMLHKLVLTDFTVVLRLSQFWSTYAAFFSSCPVVFDARSGNAISDINTIMTGILFTQRCNYTKLRNLQPSVD